MSDQNTPRHPTVLAGHRDAAAAAEAIGEMRYDALAGLLGALSRKLAGDAAADEARGRPRLAALLREASQAAGSASAAADKAWTLCRPHMADDR